MTGPHGLPCPVCGWPAAGSGPAPCPSCGLPAVGEAALVVARIGATIDELGRDRDRLLATLRAAAAPYAPAPQDAPAPQYAPALQYAPAADHAPTPAHSPSPAYSPSPVPVPPPPPWAAPGAGAPPPADASRAPGRPRISPQQVLLGLGALLLVAGAIAFTAVAWTRLGVVFQATVMLAVTAAACGVSAWAARRSLRATEEALAGAGAALLAVDLGAAHGLGLAGLDGVPVRPWTTASCAFVTLVALALGRLTPSTGAWPLVALLAAQPVPLLLVPAEAFFGAAGVAALLGLAVADLLVVLLLRPALRPAAVILSRLTAVAAGVLGVLVAWSSAAPTSWTASGLLLAGVGLALLVRREPRLAAGLPDAVPVAALTAATAATALTGSLTALGRPGPVVAALLGLALLTAAVPSTRRPEALAGTLAGGAVLAAGGGLLLLAHERLGSLALVVLAGVVPAALAAVLLPRLRPAAVGVALLAPAAAVLLATAGGWPARPTAGLLLALLAAVAFAVATLRAGRVEEWAAAGAGAVAGAAAGITTATAGAWGQVAVQLAVAGAAAGAYALAAARRPVAAAAVGDLVLACWIAEAAADVATVEAYTLPAAVGLLLLAVPRVRAGIRSWAAEGAAVGVALLPSAVTAVADPGPLRLVLVVAAAGGLTVLGTLTHRQAPFLLGAGALAYVVIGRIAPYTPLLPRWVTLATVGLVLLVLGATYERRRQQAREAVAWVAQMR